MKARVQNFTEEHKKKLMSNFAVDSVEVHLDSEQKNTMLKISSKGKNDIRADLARFLVDSEIGLLEFMEERGDLEDLFKRIHE